MSAADLRDRWRCLAEIHAAPSWLWPALAAELVARGWTVEATRGKVAALKDAPEPPVWADSAAIAAAIASDVCLAPFLSAGVDGLRASMCHRPGRSNTRRSRPR